MAKAMLCTLAYADLHEKWGELSTEEKVKRFKNLSAPEAEEFFQELSAAEEREVLLALPEKERRLWLRSLSPDDAADVLQEVPEDEQPAFLELIDIATRNEVVALLAYEEDRAGGLMNSRYVRLRKDMSCAEALAYVRKQALTHVETIYAVYVLDHEQHLVGVLSLRRLFSSNADAQVADIMRTNLVTVDENADQEVVSRLFAEHNLLAVPVVDSESRMKGIISIDDIVDVVEEEATEDIQKMGGSEALGAPYLRISIFQMIQKRVGWLIVLFIGELLTANAMSVYEKEIASAVVLATFLPLIISSGGNSGSQASTLVVRAMALDELRLKDWWKALKREFVVGLCMGAVLGFLGFLRVLLWDKAFGGYGEHAMRIGMVVGLSVVGIVLWGSLAGTFLPFVLRLSKFDPASASTPFVATLVDVTGVVIYFSVAKLLLTGTLL